MSNQALNVKYKLQNLLIIVAVIFQLNSYIINLLRKDQPIIYILFCWDKSMVGWPVLFTACNGWDWMKGQVQCSKDCQLVNKVCVCKYVRNWYLCHLRDAYKFNVIVTSSLHFGVILFGVTSDHRYICTYTKSESIMQNFLRSWMIRLGLFLQICN